MGVERASRHSRWVVLYHAYYSIYKHARATALLITSTAYPSNTPSSTPIIRRTRTCLARASSLLLPFPGTAPRPGTPSSASRATCRVSRPSTDGRTCVTKSSSSARCSSRFHCCCQPAPCPQPPVRLTASFSAGTGLRVIFAIWRSGACLAVCSAFTFSIRAHRRRSRASWSFFICVSVCSSARRPHHAHSPGPQSTALSQERVPRPAPSPWHSASPCSSLLTHLAHLLDELVVAQ